MRYAKGDPDFQAPDVPPLRFYTAAELHALVPAQVDWVVGPGLVALGAITEVDGKIKAAGKTTFTLYAVRSVLDGKEFLGYPTRRAKVVYVTEQSRETVTDALRRADMHKRRHLGDPMSGVELAMASLASVRRSPQPLSKRVPRPPPG